MDAVTSIIWDKGPTGILALGVILVLTGRLQWRQNISSQISLLADSWEQRLRAKNDEVERITTSFDKITNAQDHIIETLKTDKVTLIATLQGSVENTKALVYQQDELLESARISAPILRALQAQAGIPDAEE